MKRFGFIGTAALFVILGMAASVSAQQDDRDKPAAQPAAHDDQAAQPQGDRAPDAKPAQDEEKRTQQDDKQVQDQNKDQKNDEKDSKQAQDQDKQEQKDSKRTQPDEKNNSQDKAQQDKTQPDARRTAGNTGNHIPDDKFRAHFGQAHHFHMSHPTVVSGQPRFQYGGYWFVFGDAWPAGWGYSDDCYIDYVNGEYLLFDLAHPGASIVVSVVL
jgi:flagellar motor protein MotB